MGVSTKKTFYCDLCPATFDNGQALRDVVLPARLYDDTGEKYTKGYLKTSLCPKCLDEFWIVSDSHFCLIENGLRGPKYYPHFSVEEKNDSDGLTLGFADKVPKNE